MNVGWLTISLIILLIIFFIAIITSKCKPHCSGAFCGSNSSDGCGGNCPCKEGGKCSDKGICCYPKCNGITWGDDGCGGECKCDRIPGGILQTTPSGLKRCCYRQECDNVFCGNDGCGNICPCSTGSTCAFPPGCSGPSCQGVCSNSGTSGWTYNIIRSLGTKRKNVNSPLECSSWLPENTTNDLLNFPCSSDSDCPLGDKCLIDSQGNGFCDKNNTYQYWIYDPNDPSGYNCSKLLSGSSVCGIQKIGVSAFNIKDNIGPDKEFCIIPK